jgi:elongation factor G
VPAGDLAKIRNIGISAHIDSGKTTLTERILFYTKRIHAIHEVKGKDGVGAKMDSMDLERERGITIQSAATTASVGDNHINIIDTPGHVDFTIEVERALRVLDGAILVLCGVAGVQSQSLTVDRQMRRYNVPRIASSTSSTAPAPTRSASPDQLREKLHLNPVLLQLPIGLEDKFEGSSTSSTMKATTSTATNGEEIARGDPRADIAVEAEKYRESMLDALSMFDDELAEAMLEEKVTEDLQAPSAPTIALKIAPVMMGSAYKNKGVQLLLDGVNSYLPAPNEVENAAVDLDKNEEKVIRSIETPSRSSRSRSSSRTAGSASSRTCASTRARSRRAEITNSRTGKRTRSAASCACTPTRWRTSRSRPGDIVAMFGIDCNSGDTFTDGKLNVAMTSHVRPRRGHLAHRHAEGQKARQHVEGAPPLHEGGPDLPRQRRPGDQRDDHRRHGRAAPRRLRRAHEARVRRPRSSPSPPRVAYRETITKRTDFNYTHKKQTGGSGQYGKVAGFMEPNADGRSTSSSTTSSAASSRASSSRAVDKGFKSCSRRASSSAPRHERAASRSTTARPTRSTRATRLPGGRPRRVARGLPEGGPADPRADHEGRRRGPGEFQGGMTGLLLQRRGIMLAPPRTSGFSASRPRCRSPRCSASRRAPLRHPGQGRVHDGVLESTRAEVPQRDSHSARSSSRSTELDRSCGWRWPAPSRGARRGDRRTGA